MLNENETNSIIFTNEVNEQLNQFIRENNFSKIIYLVDNLTNNLCLPLLTLSENYPTSKIVIPNGERHKTIKTCIKIWTQLTDFQCDRKSLLINLGGGVISDMGGFCASTFKRGIKFINIPTTLLSQVDASVGGKLGIDFMKKKNHIGLFNNPEIVIIDTIFLKTLIKNELRSGYSEVIKHHLIADEKGWNNLKKKNWETSHWEDIVKHSVTIKNKIIIDDPFEQNKRKSLNFGHTIGHALESQFMNSNNHLLHGEAIALGMIAESYISFKNKLLDESSLISITEGIKIIFDNLSFNNYDKESLFEDMLQDKKNMNANIMFTLLRSIGKSIWNVTVKKSQIIESLEYLKQSMVNTL